MQEKHTAHDCINDNELVLPLETSPTTQAASVLRSLGTQRAARLGKAGPGDRPC